MAVHHRACHLCEAICGVEIEHEGARVLSVRGDREDPVSKGYICPKAVALADVHHDPDRLQRPLKKVGDEFVEIGWDEAFDEIGARLREIRERHGADAIAHYVGNPIAHNYAAAIYAMGVFPAAVGTRARYSSQSTDNLPRMLVSWLLFGTQAALPIPDVDRTRHFLVIGANPLVSNGSLMSAPGMGRRLAELRARGGRLVVIDPRRSETAEVADEHCFIRPGGDAFFLLAFLHVLFSEGLTKPRHLSARTSGEETLRALAARFTPEKVAPETGITPDTVRRLAREFAAADAAVAYGRMGVSAQEFGALATWLIDVVNVVTGNLDRVGGAMFTTPAADLIGLADVARLRGHHGTYHSRVRGLPEWSDELPVAALAEEIDTPEDVAPKKPGGVPRIRALLTSSGNPVLSTPNGARLERAFASLELMVSIDIYRNETSRHAHYILPPTFALERDHYDIVLHAVGLRNAAKWSPAMVPRAPHQRHDWEIYRELSVRLAGGPVPRAVLGPLTKLALAAATPERILALLLRTGPYGKELGLDVVKRAKHGIDLGPLEAGRLTAILRTKSKKIRLAPPQLVADVERLAAKLGRHRTRALTLIGRRELRSNNSWLHNSARLVKGRDRCTLRMHPTDAEGRGLASGAVVRVTSRVGRLEVPLEVTDEVMPGVVSLPHGYGHRRGAGVKLGVAVELGGVSANDLTDEKAIDTFAGTANLNGVEVDVTSI